MTLAARQIARLEVTVADLTQVNSIALARRVCVEQQARLARLERSFRNVVDTERPE
jgi:hypothetical protein